MGNEKRRGNAKQVFTLRLHKNIPEKAVGQECIAESHEVMLHVAHKTYQKPAW
jgi:hypothetical protein